MVAVCSERCFLAGRMDLLVELADVQKVYKAVLYVLLWFSLRGIVLVAALVLFLVLSLFLGKRLRRWARRTFEPMNAHRQEWADRRAVRHVDGALEHLGPGDSGVPEILGQGRVRLVGAVRDWYAGAPLVVLWDAVKVAALMLLLVNVGPVAKMVSLWLGGHCPQTLRSGTGTDAPGCTLEGAGLLGIVWDPKVRLAGRTWAAVRTAVSEPLADLANTLTVAASVFLLALIVMVVGTLAPNLWRLLTQGGGRRADEEVRASRTGAGAGPVHRMYRSQPVAVLLTVCESLGQAHRAAERSEEVPRVSLRPAEHVVYTAWKSRHGTSRSGRRREYVDHARRVVGALRAMESRQDREEDTGTVLRDTSVMLLKIVSRYEKGQVLRLLDAEDLEGVEPVARGDWLRVAFVAVLVSGVVVGGAALDVAGEAYPFLVAATSLIAWRIAGRSRAIGAALGDLLQGQGPRP